MVEGVDPVRSLWRLHIRADGGAGDRASGVTFCLQHGEVGMGWSVPDETVTKSGDLEWYKAAAARQYQDTSWHSVWTFAEAAKVGDVVWFRNLEGRYYLAELTDDWRYCYEGNDRVNADMVNSRPARIIEVGLADAIPGKIVACFRPAKTFQPIRSPGMLMFSEGVAGLPQSVAPNMDVFEFMSDADLENVVFVYLQVCGWYVLPGTRRTDTPHYEYVLVHRTTGERAMAQVKSGQTAINAAIYRGEERTFLFSAIGAYGANVPNNVTIIDRRQLTDFMQEEPQLLPKAVATWISIVGGAAPVRDLA